MKNRVKTFLLFIIASSLFINGYSQPAIQWEAAQLQSFESLRNGTYSFLHSRFLREDKRLANKIPGQELHTKVTIKETMGKIIFTTFLAEENPMTWELKIIDDKHAEWSTLACDCNVGLESSIFSNNPDPYKKVIALLTIANDGNILVTYHADFKKDFLDKAKFSREFFLSTYQVYQEVKQ
ncbi:MAG: hypothetical protein EOP54_12355 [Sphingobacteriales bacterium]|nr:MAG: hypothetical protein EOP54_12355 [Sphingobacteriales bacterium]